MPIVTVQCVAPDGERYSHASIQQLSDSLGKLFESVPGSTWVRLEYLDRDDSAENDLELDANVHPTFVEILKRTLPDEGVLAKEAAQVAVLTGQILSRSAENVHVIYLPEGSGRIAFGGNLVPR